MGSFNIIELQVIPLVRAEVLSGQHEVMSAPGGVRRVFIVCGTKTSFFCYYCSQDCPGVVHVCSPRRDKGRGCWGHLHFIRSPNTPAGYRSIERRRNDKSPSDARSNDRKRKWRDSKRVDNEPKKEAKKATEKL